MTATIEENVPSALVPEETPAAAGATDAPPATDEGTTPDATSEDEISRNLRDIKAQHGRELAEERRARERAERTVTDLAGKVTYLEDNLNKMGVYLSRREQAQKEAQRRALEDRIAKLPPEQQAQARIQLLTNEVRGLQAQLTQAKQPAPPPRRQPVDDVEYTRQKSQEILDQLNKQYGLSADQALTGREEEIDWDDEQLFTASAKLLAKRRAAAGTTNKESATVAKTLSVEEQIKRAVDKAMQDIGVGRPNSAKPTAGGSGTAPTSEEYRKAVEGYSSVKGPKAMRKQLEELRQRAYENMPKDSAFK